MNPARAPQPSGSLTYRQPVFAYVALGLIAALFAHGLTWLTVTGLLSTPPAAVMESQRQTGLAIWWVVASLFLWSQYRPTSRFRAALMTLGCALFIAVAGSFAVLINPKQSSEDYTFGVHIMVLLSVLLPQILLAIPASVLLQWVVLKRDTLSVSDAT